MLLAILPMYLPMVLVIGIYFVVLLAGKTRYPRGMLLFHPVTWNILLVVIPDIAQAMQVPAATWMSVMSQSSTNSSIIIWCIAAAVYEKKCIFKKKGIASQIAITSWTPRGKNLGHGWSRRIYP